MATATGPQVPRNELFPQPPVTFSFLGVNILFGTIFLENYQF